MDLRQLLQLVASGQTCFQPTDHSIEELSAFQPLAKIIIEARDLGYIKIIEPHKESSTGQRFYDLAVVKSITEAGHDFLENI